MAELINKDEVKTKILNAKDNDRFAHPLSNYGSGRLDGYDAAVEAVEQMQGKDIEWITETRPKEPGYYLVTLESELGEWDPIEETLIPNGKVDRFVNVRYFAGPNEFEDWTMEGENPAEPHWITEFESAHCERVVAWAVDRNMLIPFKGNEERGKKYVYLGEPSQLVHNSLVSR